MRKEEEKKRVACVRRITWGSELLCRMPTWPSVQRSRKCTSSVSLALILSWSTVHIALTVQYCTYIGIHTAHTHKWKILRSLCQWASVLFTDRYSTGYQWIVASGHIGQFRSGLFWFANTQTRELETANDVWVNFLDEFDDSAMKLS